MLQYVDYNAALVPPEVTVAKLDALKYKLAHPTWRRKKAGSRAGVITANNVILSVK